MGDTTHGAVSLSPTALLAWVAPRVFGGVAVVLIAAQWLVVATNLEAFAREAGGDYRSYMDAARRWLDGGSFYAAWQFAPYRIDSGAILYPPTMLLLMVPASFIPAVLWWAVPLGIISGVVWHHRPGPWRLAVIAWAFVYTYTGWLIINGTPTIWIAAFVALATVRPWAGALVLLKPSVFPFAFLGIRSRGWWLVAAGLAAVSVVLLPSWIEYVSVLRNAQDTNVFYSLRDVPLLSVGLIAAGWKRKDPPPLRGRVLPQSAQDTRSNRLTIM